MVASKKVGTISTWIYPTAVIELVSIMKMQPQQQNPSVPIISILEHLPLVSRSSRRLMTE
jgi:hypothetical protein